MHHPRHIALNVRNTVVSSVLAYPVHNADRQELSHAVAGHVLEHTVRCYQRRSAFPSINTLHSEAHTTV